jgi:glycerol-3-phosphate O-acyltransferase/dihydroxyacetone phosphate acyltransferase
VAAVYSVARRFFRRAAGLYFVDVQEEGEAHVPRTGPVVFAANHPNSLMDTVLLGSRVPRNIHYLARSGLFAHPLAAAAFRAAGVIPVQRAQDAVEGPGAGPKADNDAAFEAAFEALAAGRAVGIFPEGQNAPTRHVRAIKTGVARIALGAEAKHGFALGVVVVPVGLNYVERERFHTAALVRFGAPIPASRYRERFQDDPRAAVRALTDDVQAAMRAVAVHVPDEAQIDLAEDLHALYGAQLRDDVLGSMPDLRMPQEKLLDHATGRPSRAEQLSDRFLAEQLIANAFDWFLRTEPARAKALQKRVNEHERHLGQLRLRGDFAELPGKRLSTRAELLKLTLYAIFMAPVAAYGLFHNFVPYRLTRVAARRAPDEPIQAITALGLRRAHLRRHVRALRLARLARQRLPAGRHALRAHAALRGLLVLPLPPPPGCARAAHRGPHAVPHAARAVPGPGARARAAAGGAGRGAGRVLAELGGPWRLRWGSAFIVVVIVDGDGDGDGHQRR